VNLHARFRSAARDEHGSIFIMIALLLPVIILFASFVLDFGNWSEHKRHLHTQVDAAALAAVGNFNPNANPPCADADVDATVQDYGQAKNPQVGGTAAADVHLLTNSQTYYGQSGGGDPVDSDVTGPPCSTKMIDVKGTETNLPWFFRIANVDFTNAHARVEIQTATTSDKPMPIAVPDPNPKSAYAVFVNEDDNSILVANNLHNKGTTTLNGKSLTLWDDYTTVRSNVPVVTHTGVIIVLSGLSTVPITSSDTLSEVCNRNLVECYSGAEDGPWQGLSFVHGYASSGGTTPLVRNVRLCGASDVNCDPKNGAGTGLCNDNSAPYFILNGNCKLGIEVQLESGSLTNFQAALTGPGCGGGGCSLKPSNPCSPQIGVGFCYRLENKNQMPQVDAGAGAIRYSIDWSGKDPVTNKNVKGTIDNVHGTFAANDDPALSGPVDYVTVLNAATGLPPNNSAVTGSAVDLPVAIGVLGSLENAKTVNDPIVRLRLVKVRSGNASQTQALDCDPNPPIAPQDPGYNNYVDELAYGCWPTYKINTGEDCPGNKNTLWSTGVAGLPWPCVAITNGAKVNDVPQALNTRILGQPKPSTCSAPNNWNLFPNIPANDPRLVQVFTTPFATFTGSGQNTVPVQNFATFYVTGWTGSGSGFDNPCENNGDQFSDNPPKKGFIYGHFIKYIEPSSNSGSGTPCDFSAFGNCVAVLTR
jgi:hypothetical protein